MKTQKQTWNNLAGDWYELKNNPIKNVMIFLSKQQGKILDLGSGAGRHLTKIKNGKMYLVDFSDEMIKFARKKAAQKNIPAKFFVAEISELPFENNFSDEMIKFARKKAAQKNIPAKFFVAEISELPFENNFFDSAIAISSIHCEKNSTKREKAVKELYRVLKPKTKAYITFYNKDSKQFRNSGKEKFIRWKNKETRYYYIFDEEEAHELFKKSGFKIIKTFDKIRSIEFIVEKLNIKNSI